MITLNKVASMHKTRRVKTLILFRQLTSDLRQSKPIQLLLYVLVSVLFALSFTVQVMTLEQLFAVIEQSVKAALDFRMLMNALFLYLAVLVAIQVFKLLNNYLFEQLRTALQIVGKSKLATAVERQDQVAFEDPNFVNLLKESHKGAECAHMIFAAYMTLFTFYTPYIISMTVYLLCLHWVVPLLLAMTFIPSFLIQKRKETRVKDENTAITRAERELNTYTEYQTNPKTLAELIVTSSLDFMHDLYLQKSNELETCKRDANQESFKENLWNDLLSSGLRIVFFGVLLLLVIQGRIALTLFPVLFYGIKQIADLISEVISFHFERLAHETDLVKHYIDFREHYNYELADIEGDITHIDGSILVENLSFTYPGANYAALNQVNLFIPKGSTSVIVGPNGSGKSTLIKLLLGLYGRDVQDTNPQLRRSAIFQDFFRYELDLNENITVSESFKLDNLRLDEVKEESNLQDLPDDVVLSRKFSNLDLSYGTWQRLALARALYRDADLIVYDEPTSALDPDKEYEYFDMILKNSMKKTAIIITHRLGVCKRADQIIVLNNSHIEAVGTHVQLMKQDALYRKMYDAQASMYMN